MQNFKWQLSKTLKNAMRAKDIDTFTLSRLVGEECAKRYKNHDINVQQEQIGRAHV